MVMRRIAVTGGPGGGKTTLWKELVQRYPDRVVAVPEVATLMFSHVFPHVRDEHERKAVQTAIFHVQHSLEAVHESRAMSDQILLCDRGSPDGGGYWPSGHEAFFEAMGSSWAQELHRYDAVLFLETAAAQGLSIDAGNSVRTEDLATAVAIDRRLHAVWSAHPRFAHVACDPDFSRKLSQALQLLDAELAVETA